MSLTAEQEAMARQAVAEIKPMVDAFIRESLADPDLASRSPEFRLGWEQGFREAFVAALQMRANRT